MDEDPWEGSGKGITDVFGTGMLCVRPGRACSCPFPTHLAPIIARHRLLLPSIIRTDQLLSWCHRVMLAVDLLHTICFQTLPDTELAPRP